MNIGKANREHKKLVEECMELALIITQQLNKPRVDFTQEIIDEIGDVKWRLEQDTDISAGRWRLTSQTTWSMNLM